jgi:hypothetical protein
MSVGVMKDYKLKLGSYASRETQKSGGGNLFYFIFIFVLIMILVTHGRRSLQGFLPQLDEFYFTTPEKENFGQLQIHCSEFHE